MDDIEAVLRILGVRLFTPWHSLATTRDREQFLFLNSGDIEMSLGDLGSVVIISNVNSNIHILHASLQDFFLDPACSKEFYTDLSSIYTTYMHPCFRYTEHSTLSYFPFKRSCPILTIDEPSFQFSQRYHLCCQQLTIALRLYENTPLSASSQL